METNTTLTIVVAGVIVLLSEIVARYIRSRRQKAKDRLNKDVEQRR